MLDNDSPRDKDRFFAEVARLGIAVSSPHRIGLLDPCRMMRMAKQAAVSRDRRIFAGLLAIAFLAWGWTIAAGRGDAMTDMAGMRAAPATLDLAAFLVGWVAMMAAMMFPAIVPVVRLFALAAGRGQSAPVSVFLAGYLEKTMPGGEAIGRTVAAAFATLAIWLLVHPSAITNLT